MTLRKGFEPHLAIGETTVTGRDIEMLRAIDRFGSMHRAADELGRSYPHLQRRVVELEDAIGQLTRRARGGKDGGGTELTDDALDLIRRFERLRVELSGVTSVPESVISGTVTDQYGELATVQTAAGEISARVPEAAEDVEIAVRADAVVLMDPHSPSDGHTSLRNQLRGVVNELDIEDATATVSVEVADSVTITSVVTEESVDRLDLKEGTEVITAFKTTAARATALDS
ncbi:TOBE domain-containing protein [Natronomonas halophila]|uniref:TOBE domain-containing protein n=1 Tax=Natronomonas halophila TaxID=2747817 RepID=UPI0015B6012D|nr:TOBE domain-containing protein [Natronomonas halophila]QLD86407.1 TOBE domain-containing protein [Natronomonas halophila]